MKTTIGADDVKRIQEFSELGYGRKAIADYIGITEYAVKQVLNGNAASVVDQLSTRQRTQMLMRAFRPVGQSENNCPTPRPVETA